MIDENGSSRRRTRTVYRNSHGGNAVYGLGLIGAWVYYIQHSEGFGGFLVAVLKGIVWPAFVVYDLLRFISS
jgi:hypothetical protein